MASTAQNPSISIIGAGLSGLSLSLYLRRLVPKLNIKVYELRSASHPTSSGTINLTPNALRVLNHLGVYETIKAQGFNFDNLSLLNQNLEFIINVPIGGEQEFEFQSLRLERRLIHSALVEKIKEEGIEIVYDAKCTSIVENAKGVTVTFANGSSVTSDLLVASDGIHSAVRKCLFPDPADQDPSYTGSISIGGSISASKIEQFAGPTVKYPITLFGGDEATGSNIMIWPYDHAARELVFFTTITKKEEEKDWKSYSADKLFLKNKLSKMFDGEGSQWNDLVKNAVRLSEPETFRFWPHYIHTLPKKFYSDGGKIILVGDAAHAMPPSGGQGGAMAFEDSETLAYALFHGYTTSSLSTKEADIDAAGVPAALEAWSVHRMKRIERIQELNKRTANMRKGTSSGVMAWVKSWMIWVLGMLGVMGRHRKWVNQYNGKKEMETVFGTEFGNL